MRCCDCFVLLRCVLLWCVVFCCCGVVLLMFRFVMFSLCVGVGVGVGAVVVYCGVGACLVLCGVGVCLACYVCFSRRWVALR